MKNTTAMTLVFCALLCGCSPFKSNQPPVTVYAIHAQEAGTNAGRGPVVLIPEPVVPAGFESQKIAVYLDGGRRMDYAAGANWPAPLGKMLQGFIVQSARGQGVLPVTPEAGVTAAYRLSVTVNDFEPVYSAAGSPELRVSLTFAYVSLRNDRLLGSFTLAKTQPCANSLAAITSGMESLLRDMLGEALQRIKHERKNHD